MESNSGILFYTKLYTLLLPPINQHLLQINNTRYDLNHIECKRKQSNEKRINLHIQLQLRISNLREHLNRNNLFLKSKQKFIE